LTLQNQFYTERVNAGRRFEWTSLASAASSSLDKRGLDTVPGPVRPSKPIYQSLLHMRLRDPYYKGIVRYRGGEYPGTHEPLVDAQVWQRVQDILSAQNQAGEKQREHNHYLKGSVYCGGWHPREESVGEIIVRPHAMANPLASGIPGLDHRDLGHDRRRARGDRRVSGRAFGSSSQPSGGQRVDFTGDRPSRGRRSRNGRSHRATCR
jgi:recombinase